MEFYDLAMLTVLILVTVFGAIKGFAWQMASLASIVVSYVVAMRFRNDVAPLIKAQAPWNLYLAMLLLYVGTSFLIWIVFRLISGTIDRVRLKEFDRHLGALFGFGKGVILCFIITMFAVTLLGPNQQRAICQSRSGYYMSRILASVDGVILPAGIEQIVRPQLDQLEQKLKQGGAGSVMGADTWNAGSTNAAGSQGPGSWLANGIQSLSGNSAENSRAGGGAAVPKLPWEISSAANNLPFPPVAAGQNVPLGPSGRNDASGMITGNGLMPAGIPAGFSSDRATVGSGSPAPLWQGSAGGIPGAVPGAMPGPAAGAVLGGIPGAVSGGAESGGMVAPRRRVTSGF